MTWEPPQSPWCEDPLGTEGPVTSSRTFSPPWLSKERAQSSGPSVTTCHAIHPPPPVGQASPHTHLAETTANTRRAFFDPISAYKARVKGHTGSSGSSCKAKSLRFDEPLSEEALKAARKHRNRQRNSFDITVVERCQFVRPNLSLCDSTLISVLLAAFF